MSFRFRRTGQVIQQSRRRNDMAPRPSDRRGDGQNRDKSFVGVSNDGGLSLGSESDSMGEHAFKSGGGVRQSGDET